MTNPLDPKKRDSIIITLEGGEGSGKTTVEKEIRKKLEKTELRLMPILKEPGSTPRAELIRMVLKNVIDTSFPLPVTIRDGFNLDDFTEQAQKDLLPSYARMQIGMVMNQLYPHSTKYGILEYVYNGGFDGMPFDNFNSRSIKAQMHREGISRKLNPLVKLVDKLNMESTQQREMTHNVLARLAEEKLTPEQQARLFLAARNLLYHNRIGPAMHKKYSFEGGIHIINTALGDFDWLTNDRSCDSTVVYQGYAQDPSQVEKLREESIRAMEGIVPDLTLCLDVAPIIGLERTRKNRGIVGRDFFDLKEISFHDRVRAGYKSEIKHYNHLPDTDPQYRRIVEIDAHGTIEQVTTLAWSAIMEKLGGKIERIHKLRKAQN